MTVYVLEFEVNGARFVDGVFTTGEAANVAGKAQNGPYWITKFALQGEVWTVAKRAELLRQYDAAYQS